MNEQEPVYYAFIRQDAHGIFPHFREEISPREKYQNVVAVFRAPFSKVVVKAESFLEANRGQKLDCLTENEFYERIIQLREEEVK